MSLLDQWRNTSTQSFVPLQASLELTNRCNERCTHCYLPSFEDKKRLSLDEWLHILNELRSAGTLFLVLMGGEAMLNPHFWNIAKTASEMGFHVSMITNGLKIKSKEVAQRLKETGLRQVTVSLYSLDEEIHEKMTQVPGTLRRTQDAIRFCREAGLEVSVNCLLTKDNIEGVFALEDWCLQRDLQLKVDPNVTAKLNGDMEPTLLRASREQLEWFYQRRTERWPKSRPQATEETSEDFACNAGKGKCAVTSGGELLPCLEIREPLGSLLEKPFAELWSSTQVQAWRNIKNKDLKGTKGIEGFCEHCPGMTKNESQAPLQVSRFTQILAEVKKGQCLSGTHQI